MVKSSPINSTHYAKLYPQNNERIVTIESVTSFHAMNDGKLISRSMVFARRRQCALPLNTTVAKLPAAPILGKVGKSWPVCADSSRKRISGLVVTDRIAEMNTQFGQRMRANCLPQQQHQQQQPCS